MSHTIHPDSHVAGLADGCPRCAEHAEHPFRSLDARNIRALLERAVDRTIEPRSKTEAIAVANVLTTLERSGKIAEIAPDILERYLLESWHLPALISGGSYDMTHDQRRKDDSDTH